MLAHIDQPMLEVALGVAAGYRISKMRFCWRNLQVANRI